MFIFVSCVSRVGIQSDEYEGNTAGQFALKSWLLSELIHGKLRWSRGTVLTVVVIILEEKKTSQRLLDVWPCVV